MMMISFGWTAEAVKARRKTCTRRTWKDSHVKRFKKGDVVQAFDKDRRYKGQQISLIRLTADPVKEPLASMPASDYEAEGFAYLNEHPELVPKSMPYDVSPAGFEAWRKSGETMWVIRFEYVEENE